jgi:hypothetical protein
MGNAGVTRGKNGQERQEKAGSAFLGARQARLSKHTLPLSVMASRFVANTIKASGAYTTSIQTPQCAQAVLKNSAARVVRPHVAAALPQLVQAYVSSLYSPYLRLQGLFWPLMPSPPNGPILHANISLP